MKEEEERCCGNCCWFKHEDMDGYGLCYMHDEGFPRCSNTPCLDYISTEQMRHHLAVLLQANRYRRDQHVPAIYRMPDPKELGVAIDFAYTYIKTFDKI